MDDWDSQMMTIWSYRRHRRNRVFCMLVFIMAVYLKIRHRYNKRARYDKALADSLLRRTSIEKFTKISDERTISALRMDMNTFAKLCEVLRTQGGLRANGSVSIEEKVAAFLYILAHHEKNRVVQMAFYRSGETISRNFNAVLRSVIIAQDAFMVKPEPIPENCNEPRWKYFKGCLGALDGTYIDVTVPEVDKPRYRTRKGRISTNVLGVCDKDLNFILVFPGWEGSASDSRVLRDAVTEPDGLQVPVGNYYLVDAGYTNGPGFLAPYRGARYHLKEWGSGSRVPANYQELFNLKHAQARNVIERAFGLLKKRWAILRSPSFYPINIQGRIILACGMLHNFIRRSMSYDPEEEDESTDALLSNSDGDDVELIECVQSTPQWTEARDKLAQEMYNDWLNARNATVNV